MTKMLTLVAVIALTAGLPARQSPAADLYQEALRLQEVKGDLPAAIALYKRILDRHATEASVVPRALLQLGHCYEKLGRAEARQMYERIVRQYPNSGAPAASARAKLQAMQRPAGVTGEPFGRRMLDLIAEAGSPDGRFAARRKDDEWGRLYIRDLASGRERVLAEVEGIASNAVFSPDGKYLAFDHQHDPSKTRETRIADTTTGDVRILPRREGYPSMWLETGELIVYRPSYAKSVVEMSFVNVADGAPRRVLPVPMDGGTAAFTPDGRTHVVVRSKKLILVDVATGAERPVTRGSAEESRPVFSADGRLLAFASNTDGKWAVYVAPIDEAPVAEPLRLGYIDPAGLSGKIFPRSDWWTKDGMLTLSLSSAESNIFRVPVDGRTGRATGAPRRLTQDAARNAGPALSPDGRHIAYWYRSGAKAGLAVMTADGLNERPLAEMSGTLPLSWLSDTEILSYDFSTPAGQKPAITAYPINGGTPRKIAEVPGLYWKFVPGRHEILHWAPGGGGARAGRRMLARSIASGADRLVAEIDYLMHVVAVTRDGTRVAYSVAADNDLQSANPRCEIRVMPVAGGESTVVVPMRQPCSIPDAWSPDGQFLLISTMIGPAIVNVSSGESWPVHETAAGAGWSAGSWSPDGTFMLLANATTRSERIAWDGVTYDAVKKAMAARR